MTANDSEDDSDASTSILDSTCATFGESCVLRGRGFFVAWHGVLTFAYAGWPRALDGLKDALESQQLAQRENPGSKWPKTSIGCLTSDRRLTKEELEALRGLCLQFDARARDVEVDVNRVKAVVFANRCCEERLTVKAIKLSHTDDTGSSAITQTRLQEVEDVLAETSADDYIDRVNAPGHRSDHYSTGSGVTLVIDVGSKISELVREFRESVDVILPGAYSWFATKSLHCTVRGLVN